jgi:D,D-heptose 1,7-bisphosphate phosphatase
VTVDHLVIVAGGKGERLSAVVGNLPKALVRVGGVPVLQHQLELAALAGIRSVTIFAGYLADQIDAFVGDGTRFGLSVRVVVEAEPLGNAGAVLQSLDTLPEHFFVVYGDVMLGVDLARMGERHLEREADFTTFVHPNDHPHDSDLLETDASGWVTAVHAYPHPPNRFFANLVNAALYVVRREALRPWAGQSRKQDFTSQVIAGLIANRGRVLAYRSIEYIKDMGTPDRLQRVEADWRAGKVDAGRAQRCRMPAVFLDRDGTLNVECGFLRTAKELELLPGVGAALKSLRQGGFRLVLVTNQPVVARGEASADDVAEVHRRLEWELGIAGAYLDGIYVCPHHPDAGFPGERPELKIPCACRKPGTALIDQACDELEIDRDQSWMIGDQTRDIEMARRAGLKSVLVRTGAAGMDGQYAATPDWIADDLTAAASVILIERKREIA